MPLSLWRAEAVLPMQKMHTLTDFDDSYESK